VISAYTSKKYRKQASKNNESAIPNLLAREFGNKRPGACVVSDLTYVRVGVKWAYVCILLDLVKSPVMCKFDPGGSVRKSVLLAEPYRIESMGGQTDAEVDE